MKANQINALISEIDDILEKVQNDSFLKDEVNIIGYFGNAKDKLQNRKYTVSVVAAMKAGKSTTFNAFVGRDLLPNENAACTTAITEIKHVTNASDHVKKIFHSGEIHQIKASASLSLEETFHEDVRHSRNGEISNIKKYAVETPILALENMEYKDLLQNFLLIDTPGPNEASTNDFDVSILQKMALDQLRNSDALIMLLDYQTYKSETNQKILTNIFENRDDLVDDKDKLFFVINKIDAMTDKDGTKEEVIEKVSSLIKEHASFIKKPKVFTLSAKQASMSRMILNKIGGDRFKKEVEKAYGSRYSMIKNIDGVDYNVLRKADDFAHDLLEESNVLNVEKQIIGNVFDRASVDLIDGGFERVHRGLNNILTKLNSQINVLQMESSELNSIINSTKNNIEKVKIDSQKLNNIPKEKLNNLKSQIDSIVSKIESNIVKLVEQSFPTSTIIESDSQEMLQQQINTINNNITSAIEIAINRDVDKVQRLVLNSQSQINQELNNAFLDIADEINKVVEGNNKIRLQTFDMDDINRIALEHSSTAINSDYENHNAGEITSFDGKSAFAGTTAGAAAGAKIGTLILPGIGTAVGTAVGAVIGFFIGGKKTETKIEKKQTFKADISDMKSTFLNNAKTASQNVATELNNVHKKSVSDYNIFVTDQLKVYFENIDKQLDEILYDYKKGMKNKEENLSNLNNLVEFFYLKQKILLELKEK